MNKRLCKNSDVSEFSELSDGSLNLEKILPSGKQTNCSPFNSNKMDNIIFSPERDRDDGDLKSGASPRRKRKILIKTIKRQGISDKYFSSGGVDMTNNLNASRFDIVKSLRISRTVRKFANKMKSTLKSNYPLNRLKLLRKYHFDIIDDKSFAFKESEVSVEGFPPGSDSEPRPRISWRRLQIYIKNKIFGFLGATAKQIPMFNPSSFWKILWDFSITLGVFIKIICLSVEFSFDVDIDHSQEFNIFNFSLFVLILLDAVVTLNTIYFREGKQVAQRRDVWRNYVRKHLLVDLLLIISFLADSLIFSGKSIHLIFDLVFILKLLKFFETEERVKSILIRNIRTESLYKVITLIAKIFLVAHLLACIWHYLAYKSFQGDPGCVNWLVSKDIVHEAWPKRYLYSVYWAFTTMLTVGYGDITPTNPEEVVFTIWAMLIGCGIFGYSMNYIGEILAFVGRSDRLLKEQRDQVTGILRKKHLPGELQTRVLKYLEFIWKQEASENPQQENLLMSKLSSQLRDEVYLHTHVHYLKKVKAFRFFQDRTLIALASRMKKVRFSPEEFVYKRDDRGDSSLFFVIDGQLEVVSNKAHLSETCPLQNLRKNDFIGLHELFSDERRKHSVVSIDFSSLFQLTRADFLAVLMEFPQEYEKFCKQRDEIILYNQLEGLKIECLSCFSDSHRLEECPFFNYAPDKLAVIRNFEKQLRKFEKGFLRHNSKHKNALAIRPSIKLCCEELKRSYEEDEEYASLLRLYGAENDQYNESECEDFMRSEEEDEKGEKNQLVMRGEKRRRTDIFKQTGYKLFEKAPTKKFEAKIQNEETPQGDLGSTDRIRSFQHYYVRNNIENVVRSTRQRRNALRTKIKPVNIV